MKQLLFSLILGLVFISNSAFAETIYKGTDLPANPNMREVKTETLPPDTSGQSTMVTTYDDGTVRTIMPNRPSSPIITWKFPNGSIYQTKPGTTDQYIKTANERPPTITPGQQTPPQIKTPTEINILNSVVNPSNLGLSGLFNNPINKLLNQLFYIGLVAAVILAIVMIIRGGIEYMTIDAIASKENGKRRVQAALGGLVLAFSAILILNTINPGLTNLNITFEKLKMIASIGVDSGLVSGTRPGAGTVIPTGGNFGSWEEYAAEDWVKGLSNGDRSTDGRLVVTTYWDGDTNTNERRGNSNNLLREGSVALSPDLIEKYKPQVGQEIFIDGTSIGFYEDTAGKPDQWKNTVDIYDRNGTLGSWLKNIPAGQWNLTLGQNKRPQISNP